MPETSSFTNLTPDLILSSVEHALDIRLNGLLTPLPSYINRVYEVHDEDNKKYIVKFYRPGRWKYEALFDEHNFLADCNDDEIPVVCPLALTSGKTLGQAEGFYFAIFPKRSGRIFELNSPDDYRRAGSLIARVHVAGKKKQAVSRISLHPELSTKNDILEILELSNLSGDQKSGFKEIAHKIVQRIIPLFDGVVLQRIHGDCHPGNILDRFTDGLMLIDFDDMMSGPAVQDLWLLLPEHIHKCPAELAYLLNGYRQISDIDDSTLKLVEALRAMRIIYFLTWCARQRDDYKFNYMFPEWGTEAFWEKEIYDLTMQLEEIEESLQYFSQG